MPTSKRAKVLVAVAVCAALAAAGATGCGSPSSQAPAQDAGSSADTGTAAQDASVDAATVSCDPLRDELCPQGQTCCFSGLRGTCADVGSCERPFQVSCTSSAACGAMGEGVCCGSVRVPAGFDPSAFDASAFDASAFDPSTFDASGFGVTFACAEACAAPDFQLCAATQECPTGDVCAGGMGTGLGFLLTCTAADAGASLDAGDAGASTGDAGTDAGPADASVMDGAGGG